MNKFIILSSSVFLLPVVVLAQFGEVDTFVGNLNIFISSRLVPFVFTLALLVFVYGMYKYFILGGANEADREKGKQLLVWAVMGFVLMVSIWGIVGMLSTGIFGGGVTPPPLPETPTL
ncbi:MAG: hypothetical protein ACI92I_000408 [Acidimicrobiales bacterium]|jgi:hypothetical protein